MKTEMSYEESLETMTEDMLRSECVRQHDKVLVAYRKLLTQPALDTRQVKEVKADMDKLIAKKRIEFSQICQQDTSPPTTAEINQIREIRALVIEREAYHDRVYADYEIEASENID